MAKTSWPLKTLDEFFDSKPKSSESLRQKDYLSSGKFPVVDQGQELIGGFTNDQQLVRDFEIPVIVFGDHTRCVKYVDFPFASGADGTKILVPRKGVDPKYAYYQLLSIELPTKGYARHFGELSKRSFVLPPLREQKRIVALLDAATARVTELTTCYEQARTHANNLFTSALRDALESNLDWPIKRLDNISDVRDGTHDSPRSSESGFPLVTSKNIRQGQISLEGSYLISALDYEQISRRSKVDKFDVLISMIGTVGEVCMVTSEPNFAIKNVGLIKTRNESLSRFLLYFLLSPDGKNQIRNSESGTTQRFIGLGKLRGLEIPVPPLGEQKRIVTQLDLMRAKTSEMVAAYDAKLTAAKNLRQSILEAAFAGAL